MEARQLSFNVYLYNPDNLKGIHEVDTPFTMEDGRPVAAKGVMEPCHYITVDGETFYVPWIYVTEGDVEEIPGRTIDDL